MISFLDPPSVTNTVLLLGLLGLAWKLRRNVTFVRRRFRSRLRRLQSDVSDSMDRLGTGFLRGMDTSSEAGEAEDLLGAGASTASVVAEPPKDDWGESLQPDPDAAPRRPSSLAVLRDFLLARQENVLRRLHPQHRLARDRKSAVYLKRRFCRRDLDTTAARRAHCACYGMPTRRSERASVDEERPTAPARARPWSGVWNTFCARRGRERPPRVRSAHLRTACRCPLRPK